MEFFSVYVSFVEIASSVKITFLKKFSIWFHLKNLLVQTCTCYTFTEVNKVEPE